MFLFRPFVLQSVKGHRRWFSTTATADRVQRVLEAKTAAGLSYDDLAKHLGVTNTYAAQLLLGQAKLTSTTADKLQQILPTLSSDDIKDMQTTFPMRSFDDNILKEPNVYRTYEAITHYGEAIKAIINEQCGDGIMSAIDFYCDVGTTTGKHHGEKRVVITFNGKFLPFIEQKADDNTVQSPRDWKKKIICNCIYGIKNSDTVSSLIGTWSLLLGATGVVAIASSQSLQTYSKYVAKLTGTCLSIMKESCRCTRRNIHLPTI
jgi:cyanate lyase